MPTMPAMNGERPGAERRNRRASCLADALRFQLDACREDEGLAAIVVADELGFCVAHSGGDGVHDEWAAQLPMLADPARRGRGARADDTPGAVPVAVTTFSVPGATLHACAVAMPAPQARAGADGGASGRAVLERVASGFSRMLAE